MTDWREQAVCASVGDRVFFPGKGEKPSRAKAICGQCPVQAECLEFALTTKLPDGEGWVWGVWGGTTEAERTGIRSGKSTPCLECKRPVYSRGAPRHEECSNRARARTLREWTAA